MQEKHLYEYSVIRVLPVLEREEFINVGVILFCKKAKYIKLLYSIDKEKFSFFCQDLDLEELLVSLYSLEKIAHGNKKAGPMAALDIPERFRWLTATRSSSIQMTKPHPGLCTDLDKTTKRLFGELVL